MTRRLITGVVVVAGALLGCKGEPAPTRRAEVQPEPPPVVAQPEPAPPTPAPPPAHPTEHYVPPIVGKVPTLKAPPIRTQVWDIGVVPPGAKLDHRFAITNDSDVPWTVKFVTPDCKCTVGKFTLETVKPKETTHLAAAFRADQREGPVLGSIAVDFREVQAPTFLLYVKAEVRKPLSALPAAVDFGRLGPAERVSRTVEVRNYSDGDLPPPAVQAPDWVTVEVKPAEKKAENNRARQTWELTLHNDPAKFKSAAEPGSLVVRAGDLGPVTVPLALKLKAPLEPIPGEVVLENFKPGTATERTFLLETYPDLSALTENDLELRHDVGDELTAEVAKKIGTNRFQIVVRYRPRAAYASVEGELTVAVRGRDVPPARVKVRGNGG